MRRVLLGARPSSSLSQRVWRPPIDAPCPLELARTDQALLLIRDGAKELVVGPDGFEPPTFTV